MIFALARIGKGVSKGSRPAIHVNRLKAVQAILLLLLVPMKVALPKVLTAARVSVKSFLRFVMLVPPTMSALQMQTAMCCTKTIRIAAHLATLATVAKGAHAKRKHVRVHIHGR